MRSFLRVPLKIYQMLRVDLPLVGGGAKAVGAITAAALPYGEAGVLIEMAKYYEDQLDAKIGELKTGLATPINGDQTYYFDKWDFLRIRRVRVFD